MNGPSKAAEKRPPLAKGLVLFPPGTSPGHRRRRLLFVAIYLVLVAALVWPVYPLLAPLLPPILGLPPSIAWVVLVLVAAFAVLLGLYLSEDEPRPGPSSLPGSAAAGEEP